MNARTPPPQLLLKTTILGQLLRSRWREFVARIFQKVLGFTFNTPSLADYSASNMNLPHTPLPRVIPSPHSNISLTFYRAFARVSKSIFVCWVNWSTMNHEISLGLLFRDFHQHDFQKERRVCGNVWIVSSNRGRERTKLTPKLELGNQRKV